MKPTLLIPFLFLIGFTSCGELDKIDQIDLKKTENLIPILNQFDFNKIELRDEQFVINDTLIKFDTDISKNIDFWVKDSTTALNWIQKHNYVLDSLITLRHQIKESKNYQIIKERDVYFFSEGGWIDSNYGKAYSKINIIKAEAKFKFDRVQSIKAINGRPNWYEYFAD